MLGRALFSGNFDPKKGKINVGAFMINDPSKGISVNRLTLAPSRRIDFLSRIEAQRRTDKARRKNSKSGDIKFYGYASIKSEDVGFVEIEENNCLVGIKVTPTFQNPFHADITLPAGREKDFYLAIADALQQKAAFQAHSE